MQDQKVNFALADPTTDGPETVGGPPPIESVLALRLKPDHPGAIQVRQVLVAISVAKPPKQLFFRAKPGAEASADLYLLDATKLGGEGVYAVSPNIADLIADQVRRIQLRLVVTAQGVPYLVPVTLPGPDGKWNPWHQSLARALEHAETTWIRISADMVAGGYAVFEAVGNLPEPEWPAKGFDELLELAFRGRLITTEDHPLVRQLFGGA
jgi:hypothetical protein